MNEREQLCKKFTLLTGGHWHEITFEDIQTLSEKAGISLIAAKAALRDDYNNPTYENPTNILKVIYDNFGDAELQSFLCWTGYYNQQDDYDLDWIKDNLFEPDTLLKKAIEFLIEMEKWK